MSIRTLSELFLHAISLGKPDCLMHKVEGTYRPISSAELGDQVFRLAKSFEELGVRRGDHVALMSDNGPHWAATDFAILGLGAVLIPIYPTLTPDQASYIANDCGARIVIAETEKHLQGFLEHSAGLEKVEKFVLIKGTSDDPRVVSFSDLMQKGAGYDRAKFEASARASQPEDLATFIYTSGTTGQPKGVMLTHGNIVSNLLAAAELFPAVGAQSTALSFLPLSHSFERTVDYFYYYKGVTIAYAESVNTVPQNLQEVKPHLFVSVPRVYEKFLARVNEGVAAASPIRQKMFHWAVGVGKRAIEYRLKGTRPGGVLGIQLSIADKLVFSKVRTRLGGRFEIALSGGAPLGRDIAEFFWGAGIPIYEGYGLSETSPVISVNSPGHAKLGTVGRAVRDVVVRIAEDGEILSKGPNIMKGYWGLPEATKEAIDADGWFHTGDIGEVDGEGFLRITDRKKELIVNANGKNIAPAPIENSLKASQYIAQAVVIGDRRKFLSALLVPDYDNLKGWAGKQGLPTERAALFARSETRALLAQEVGTVNKKLAKFEQIVAWEILPDEFTIETGELTPTMKVKRRVINQKYGDVIDRLYAEADAKHGG
ncbi:MAG: long-chain fatty acid--CoA ligase [Acidobacteriota bacterium]